MLMSNPPISPALTPTPEEILDSARPFEVLSPYILMTYDEATMCLYPVRTEQLDALKGRLYVFPVIPPVVQLVSCRNEESP